MSGGGTTTQIQELNPTQEPFVKYGLDEAKRLYESGMPAFFPEQTFVGPSDQTTSALAGIQNRAIQGNALVPAAQQQYLDTIQGDYLSSTNPYFQARFDTASDAATQKYFDAVNQINSQASLAGRYGSGAQADLMDRAQGNLAQSLTNTAGELAFNNYAQERGRQLGAAQLAPAMAEADYGDLQRLAGVGQVTEGYQDLALQDAINRFDFQQNLPQNTLQQYLTAAYGAPMGGQTTTPTQKGGLMGALGGALTGYGLAGMAPAGSFLAANPMVAAAGMGLLASGILD